MVRILTDLTKEMFDEESDTPASIWHDVVSSGRWSRNGYSWGFEGGAIRNLNLVNKNTSDKNVVRAAAEIINEYAYSPLHEGIDVAEKLGEIAEYMGERVKTVIEAIKNLHQKYYSTLVDGFESMVIRKQSPDVMELVGKTMNSLHERDPDTAVMIGENAPYSVGVFGNKCGIVLKYFERRRDRKNLTRVREMFRYSDKIAANIENIKLTNFGNRQAKKLLELAYLLDWTRFLKLEPKVSEKLDDTLDNAKRLLRVYGINADALSDDHVGDELHRNVSFISYKLTPDQIRKLCKTVSSLYETNVTAAEIVSKSAHSLLEIFGDKLPLILNYLEKSIDMEDMSMINNIGEYSDIISNDIKNMEVTDLNDETIKKLIRVASLLNYNYILNLHPKVTKNLEDTFGIVEDSVKEYMNNYGIVDIDKGMKFLPWIKTKDETALKVLRGEKVEKSGIARTYELRNGSEINLEDLRKEIQSYANMAGLGITVGEGDLFYLKNMAQMIMAGVDKKKDLGEDVLGEIKPNLKRILDTTHKGSRNYVLIINPSDLESQMEALQYVTSCLSPGGCNFKYTQEYLANPNTFWAVIKDGDNVIGRVTVFMGKDEKENEILARVSKVYSITPMSEGVIDRGLKEYAKEIGAEFMVSGEMFVSGLNKVYDDYVNGGTGQIFVSGI